jgi:hypothetical protein
MLVLRRWVATDEDGFDGSIFACSKQHAKEHAEDLSMTLGECQGTEGVDEMTTCSLSDQNGECHRG